MERENVLSILAILLLLGALLGLSQERGREVTLARVSSVGSATNAQLGQVKEGQGAILVQIDSVGSATTARLGRVEENLGNQISSGGQGLRTHVTTEAASTRSHVTEQVGTAVARVGTAESNLSATVTSKAEGLRTHITEEANRVVASVVARLGQVEAMLTRLEEAGVASAEQISWLRTQLGAAQLGAVRILDAVRALPPSATSEQATALQTQLSVLEGKLGALEKQMAELLTKAPPPTPAPSPASKPAPVPAPVTTPFSVSITRITFPRTIDGLREARIEFLVAGGTGPFSVRAACGGWSLWQPLTEGIAKCQVPAGHQEFRIQIQDKGGETVQAVMSRQVP